MRDAHDESSTRLAAESSKNTWRTRVLTAWCLLLTWHVLDKDGGFERFVGHRNQPLLAGSIALLVILVALWSHGRLWARPRDETRLRLR
ncbi:MAG TPA: hypothetical protein VFG69_11255 [Nannocystaceae bacterium]|nr:hypothetical protein [Nannocystaceae bacterium]